MKYLLVLLVVVVAIYLWRSNRRAELHAAREDDPARAARRQPPRLPEAMTRCALCDMHLPAADAVSGRQGDYCCEAHRRQAEG